MRFAITIALGLCLITACGPSDGPYTAYYDNEQIKETGFYKNGEKTGKWIYYWKNGNIQTEGYYASGEPNGSWKFYDQSGKLVAEGTYKDGNMWNGTFVRYVFGTMKFITVEEGKQTTP